MYERTPWLIRLWSSPTEETRIVADGSTSDFEVAGGKNVMTERADPAALPLRTDDTLAVFTYKLQAMLGRRVYWWACDPSGTERCPYMENGRSAREPLDAGLRVASEALLDLYETHLQTNVVNVMYLDAVLQLNPRLAETLSVDAAVSIDPTAVADAEEALAAGDDVETYTGKVTTYVVNQGCTRAAVNDDTRMFAKLPLDPPFTMVGIHTPHDTSSVRVSERAVTTGDLKIDDAHSMAGHLVRVAARQGTLLLVSTSLDGRTCETIVGEGGMQTAVKAEMVDLEAAQAAAAAAQEAVHKLRRTRPLGGWLVSALHLSATFDTVMMSKGDLRRALQRLAPLLYSEPQEDGSVVVHLRRVPRFVATNGRMQFLEMYAYMLEEGQFDELSRMLAREFGIAVEDARREVGEFAEVRELEVANTNTVAGRGARPLTAVGAMAVLKVGNRGLRASVRSEGPLSFVHRLLWIIGRIRSVRPREAVSPTEVALSAPVDDVQAALQRVRQLESSAAAPGALDDTAPNMYVIERLNAYDPRLFRYEGVAGTTYARQCGAVDQRQPIALSDASMRGLRAQMPAADIPQTVQLGEGGTHYMCPELWCRRAQRPLTREEAAKNGGKCPDEEQPMDMGVSAYWKDAVKRFPGLLAAEKHPLGLHAPCCFKNLKQMMRDRLQECEDSGQCAPGTTAPAEGSRRQNAGMYKFTTSSVPLAAGREGTLPSEMPAWAFGKAVRVGVTQDFDPVSNAVCHALRLQRHELVDRVGALGVLQVARIARGNLLRRFINQTMHLHDPRVKALYADFRRSAAGRTYAKQVGTPDALRDFTVWNGYYHVQQFMAKGRARNHVFVVPLLTAALQVGIVVLERSETTGVSIHCPYGGNVADSRTRVVVLKQGAVYEPLANVSDQTLARLHALAERACESAPRVDESHNAALVRTLREREKLNVERQVVSMSFEAVGVMASGLFVPYRTPTPCDLNMPMVFTAALPTSAAGVWTPKKVDALFKRLAKTGDWYRRHEMLVHGESVTAHVGDHFVPVRGSHALVKLARTDVMLFANAGADTDERRPYVQRRLALARTHELMMMHLVSKHPDALYVATHARSPLPREVRMDMLMELTSSVSGIAQDVHALASNRLVSGQHMFAASHKHHRKEVVADEQDIIDGTLLYMLQSLTDEYGNIATVRTAMRDALPGPEGNKRSVFVEPGNCPKAWRSTLAGLQLLRASEPGVAALAAVVVELGGARLTADAFADVVAKEYMKAFDTGKGRPARDMATLHRVLSGSQVPSRTARRLAVAATPNAATAAAALSMCDVNVLAVDARGSVVGHHASDTDRYVTCFEQEGGGVAFVSLAGSRVLGRGQLPAGLAARFQA